MSIDFTSPVKTQLYDTGLLASLRANQIAMASFLDGHAIAGAVAGVKRYNASSKLFEQTDGTTFTEMPLAYLKLAGGTLTGALTLAGDGSAALHAVSKQQLDTAINTRAASSALNAYMPTSGGSFTGNIEAPNIYTPGVAISAAGIQAPGDVTINGQFFANGTGSGRFLMASTSGGVDAKFADLVATPGAIQLRFLNDAQTAASAPFQATRTGFATTLVTLGGTTTVAGGLNVLKDAGGGYSGDFKIGNPTTGFATFLRANGGAGLEVVNSAYSAVNLTITDTTGDVTSRGLLFGRGGGAGLGQIHVQEGGSPSGGAPGDLWLIH